MSGKELETELPAPMANITMIFVCLLLVIWFLKAFRRFARTVLLRRSLMFGNIVQIQGLASYLSYFDGATRAHLNSIVETRQSKPAVPMDILYVSCFFDTVQLTPTTNPAIVLVSIRLKVMIPGKLYLLSNFDSSAFKKVVHQNCLQQNVSSKYGYRDIGTIFRETLFAVSAAGSNISNGQGLVALPFLSAHEVCLNEGYVHEIDNVGSHTINVAIKSPFPSAAEDKSLYNISLCFIPDPMLRDTYMNSLAHFRENFEIGRGEGSESGGQGFRSVDNYETGTPIHSKRNDSQEGTQGLLSASSSNHRFLGKQQKENGFTAELWQSFSDSIQHNVFNQRADAPTANRSATEIADLEAAGNSTTAANNSNANTAQSNSDSAPIPLQQYDANAFNRSAANAVAFSFPIPKYLPHLFPVEKAPTLPANAAVPPPPASPTSNRRPKKDIHPREILVVDSRGQIYNSLEIFGLGPVNDAPTSSLTALPTPIITNLIGTNGAVAAPPLASSSPSVSSSMLSMPNPTAFSGHSAFAPETLSNHPTRVAPDQQYASAPGTTASGTPTTRPNVLQNSDASELNNLVRSHERENPGHTNQENQGTKESTDGAAEATLSVSSLALAQGGKYVSEECVVCLTDPKEILLLPCRHLCVCAACFVFVDKCPVCRALFDQYAAIQGGTKVKFQSHR